MGAAVLANIGMHELIAASAADYVAIASRIAADPASLGRLRAGLRERMAASPCCDGPRAARELEDAFLQMAR
jgi:predicted O-linked N-acetylglucosamine transferase (SPINDLY family)